MATTRDDQLAPPVTELRQIDIKLVRTNGNVRRELGDISELTTSIKTVGILEPLLVVADEDEKGAFIVVCGSRRLAAAKAAKVTSIPALVCDLEETERIQVALIENLQRSDLSPTDEAWAYQELVDLGLSQYDIAAQIGRSQSHVAKRVALLKLPKLALDRVAKGSLTLEDAFVLTKLAKEPQRIERIVKDQQGNSYMRISSMVDQELRKLQVETKRKPVIEKLRARGIRVLGATSIGYMGKQKYLGGDLFPHLEPSIDAKTHAKSDCHAAVVDEQAKVRYVCTDPGRHEKSGQPKAKKDAVDKKAKAEREADVAAWNEARPLRRAFEKKLMAKPSAGFVIEATAHVLARGRILFEMSPGETFNALADLGEDDGYPSEKAVAELLEQNGGEAKLVLATAISSIEQDLSPPWGEGLPSVDDARPALEFLKKHGYELSDVEQRMLSKNGRR